jgi:hypothetical protein
MTVLSEKAQPIQVGKIIFKLLPALGSNSSPHAEFKQGVPGILELSSPEKHKIEINANFQGPMFPHLNIQNSPIC